MGPDLGVRHVEGELRGQSGVACAPPVHVPARRQVEEHAHASPVRGPRSTSSRATTAGVPSRGRSRASAPGALGVARPPARSRRERPPGDDGKKKKEEDERARQRGESPERGSGRAAVQAVRVITSTWGPIGRCPPETVIFDPDPRRTGARRADHEARSCRSGPRFHRRACAAPGKAAPQSPGLRRRNTGLSGTRRPSHSERPGPARRTSGFALSGSRACPELAAPRPAHSVIFSIVSEGSAGFHPQVCDPGHRQGSEASRSSWAYSAVAAWDGGPKRRGGFEHAFSQALPFPEGPDLRRRPFVRASLAAALGVVLALAAGPRRPVPASPRCACTTASSAFPPTRRPSTRWRP